MAHILTWKKFRSIGMVLLLIATAVFGIRACMANTFLKEEVYIIAYDSTWYPTDLRGKGQNMVVFCHDILRAIAAETDFEVGFVEVGAASLYGGLKDEYYNAVLSTIIPNVVSRREYDFSDVIYPLGPVLVVKENSNFHDISDLKGKVIGVEKGMQSFYEFLQEGDFVMIPFRDIPLALESLDRGVSDAVLMDVLTAYSYTMGFYKGRLKVATPPLIDGGVRLVTLITPRNEAFLEEFNRGLKKIKEEGVYDSLLKKWDLVRVQK